MKQAIVSMDDLMSDIIDDVTNSDPIPTATPETAEPTEHEETLDELTSNWATKTATKIAPKTHSESVSQAERLLSNVAPIQKLEELLDAVLRGCVSGPYIVHPLVDLFGMEREKANELTWKLDYHPSQFGYHARFNGVERKEKEVEFFARLVKTYRTAANRNNRRFDYIDELNAMFHNRLFLLNSARRSMEKFEMKNSEEKFRANLKRQKW